MTREQGRHKSADPCYGKSEFPHLDLLIGGFELDGRTPAILLAKAVPA